MREYGGKDGERVIRSLISYPRMMGMRALLSTLPVRMRMDMETDRYREYVTMCLRMLTENTAHVAAYFTDGERGTYMTQDFAEIMGMKREMKQEMKPGEVTNSIRTKLREG